MLCPYCSRPRADWNSYTDDHIFVKSLGGRATVPACGECNNKRLGQELEGSLLGPGNSLLKMAKGAPEGKMRLRGTLGEQAHEVEVDLSPEGARVHFRRPIIETDDSFTVVGTREEVRARILEIVKRRNLSADQLDELLKLTDTAPAMANDLTSELDESITDLARLAAKVALGCLGRAGDEAVVSPLADGLRAVLWNEMPDVDRLSVSVDALPEITDAINGALPEGFAIQPIEPTDEHGRVILLPIGQGVGVFVYLVGVPLGFEGVYVKAPMPFGGGLAVIFDDAFGGLQVRHVEEEIGGLLGAYEQSQL